MKTSFVCYKWELPLELEFKNGRGEIGNRWYLFASAGIPAAKQEKVRKRFAQVQLIGLNVWGKEREFKIVCRAIVIHILHEIRFLGKVLVTFYCLWQNQ